MPYIGNNHIVGDHINNFKVLDDISSYTATFDGSSTNVVSTSDETLRIVEHRFVQGQRVTYNNGGGSNIGGLASGTAYYVSFDTANTIKLATSLVNANNGTLINLTSAGGGTTHTLTAAFDSTNTKFKLTHNGGESGRFNNATQLQVAINNVLQRPNSDPDNFTEGFAVEGGNKIVFQTAPTSNDIFWGSIIANSLPTFDIDAAAIDNFTGDGSTTDFTLSRIPPNNASIIVTINGVFQHLSDTTTARAYSLEASVIKFTSAPASGDEIQVRHTGFRGALGDIVTGFYGRTGNVSLIASDDILTRNINSSGIITASSFSGDGSGLIGVASTDNIVTGTAATFNTYPVDINAGMTVAGVATFSGNVSIAGTLTYEDVKNVDSIGIITARSGVDVDDFLDVGSNIKLGNAGVITATTFSGSGASLTGIANANVASNAAIAGSKINPDFSGQVIKAQQLEISYHTPQIKLIDVNNDSDFDVMNQNGVFKVYDRTNSVGRLHIASDGTTDIFQNLNVGAGIDVTGNSTFVNDIDVDGHTNLDNINIAGVTTVASDTSFIIGSNATSKYNIDFKQNSSNNRNSIDSYFMDFSIHDLQIQNEANNSIMAYFWPGEVALYSVGSKKFSTHGSGIKVHGVGDGHGILLDNTTYRNNITAESNRPGAVNSILEIDGKWNNTQVAFITLSTGDDTTNKDDGRIRFFTKPSGGSISERLRIEPDGQVVFGGASSRNVGFTHRLQIEDTNDTPHGFSMISNRANIYGPHMSFAKSRGSTRGSVNIVQANDELATILFRGADGTDISTTAAQIDVRVDGTPGSNHIPGSFEFYTRNAASQLAKRLVINSSGHLMPGADSTYNIGSSSVRFANVYADTLYGDGSNLSNVISGVDLKFEGASVGTGVTMLNFVGFNTVTAPVSGLSTITSGQNLTIGVRSGSAVEASLTGTSFNVIARSGGNIAINI